VRGDGGIKSGDRLVELATLGMSGSEAVQRVGIAGLEFEGLRSDKKSLFAPFPQLARAVSSRGALKLAPPLVMTLERSLEYIGSDEYVEATPKSLRLRKKILDANMRKRSSTKVEA
jgi:GTP-binding protein